MSLPRERLTSLLAESALTSVELVIAPPGYGKTTLLREYAAADAGALFIALPESTDLEAFVRSIIAAAVPSAIHSIGALFGASADAPIESRVADWLASRLRAFDGTLIIDDFHRSSADARVASVLVATIAATHGRMRWIVASRESPSFPMGTWISRGWMGLPITGDDLGFTQEEAAALAESLSIAAGADDIAAILEETLGWPIGVRLALSLVARKRGIAQTRVQTRDALFALLDDEMWKPLDRDLRELIAAAALMPSPSIETLVSAGFTAARSRIETVFARVPFVAPIDENAFAIHDLFREFVATQVAREAATDGAVEMRVGTALVAGGNPADGLRLLVSVANVAGVTDALADHAFDLLETGQRSVVNAAITFLSDHGLGDTGLALAVRGALAFADGSASNSVNLFVRALDRDAPASIRGEVSRRLATSYANRGMLAEAMEVIKPLELDESISLEDRLEVSAMSASFMAVAGSRERSAVNATIASLESQVAKAQPNVQASLLRRLGNAAFYNGDPETAERLSLDAALLATELGLDTVAALAYSTLYSIAAFFDSDATRAQSFSRSQGVAAERAANTALHVYALRAQYVTAALNVDATAAQALEAALASLVDTRAYRDAFPFRFARALLFVAESDVAKAEATIRSMPTTSLSAPERARRDNFLTLLLLLRGKRNAAAAALDRGLLAEVPSDPAGRLEMAYAFAYRGLAYWALDRPAQARKALEFTTADLPQRSQILVGALKALTELPHPLPNSSALDGVFATLAAAGFRAYGELLRRLIDLDANDATLSAAELETLREFDRHGGRAVDVARALGKSKFTVQNQIQSVIRKLGCSGRAEALAYARQRGWLDRASN
jgi:ATP/maltotriose-dependent transcriptional regulator MalT/DNA-binding CsgD family transcriptional regulator